MYYDVLGGNDFMLVYFARSFSTDSTIEIDIRDRGAICATSFGSRSLLTVMLSGSRFVAER